MAFSQIYITPDGKQGSCNYKALITMMKCDQLWLVFMVNLFYVWMVVSAHEWEEKTPLGCYQDLCLQQD